MKQGWEHKKLGSYIKEYSVKNKLSEEIPVYSVTNSQGFCKDYFGKEVASQDKSTYKIVPYGFFAYNPSRINVGSIDWQSKEDRVIVSPLYNVFSVSSDLMQQYLLYYLKSPATIHYIDSIATGTVRLNLKLSLLKEFILPIPSLSTQEKIVSELDKINELIRLKKEQLKDYDNLAQSIFYEMFGDPVENEKGWEVKTIKDTCFLKSGDSKANNSHKGDLPYVKVGDMNLPGNENYINISTTYVDRESNINRIFPIGTIIFPKRGGAILTNKKRLTNVEICCDLNTMGVIPGDMLNKYYLFQYFKILDLSTICSGSTVLQLNNCDINPLIIPLPPLPLQHLFAQRIEQIERQKSAVQKSITDLETLLASRMQYWFE